MRPLFSLHKLVSLALTISYLGASLVDCEPPNEWALPAGTEAHAGEAVGAGGAMGQHAHSAEAPHGHDPAGAGSNAGHAAHGDTHHAGPTEPRLSAKKGQLELQPTCLCGCSETRSLIGGSASRLGAVVPGVSLVQLPDSSPVPVPGLDRLRWHDRFGPSDPVPI